MLVSSAATLRLFLEDTVNPGLWQEASDQNHASYTTQITDLVETISVNSNSLIWRSELWTQSCTAYLLSVAEQTQHQLFVLQIITSKLSHAHTVLY